MPGRSESNPLLFFLQASQVVVFANIVRPAFGHLACRYIINRLADVVQKVGRHVGTVLPHDGINIFIQMKCILPIEILVVILILLLIENRMKVLHTPSITT